MLHDSPYELILGHGSASGVLSFVFRLGWFKICWSVSILPLLQLQFRHDICLWTVSPFQHYRDPVSLVYSSVSSQHGPASWYLKCQVDANGTVATHKIWNSHSRLWQNWLKTLRRGPTALFFLAQSICHNHMKCLFLHFFMFLTRTQSSKFLLFPSNFLACVDFAPVVWHFGRAMEKLSNTVPAVP